MDINASSNAASPENASRPEAERPTARVISVENGGLLFTDNPAGVSGTDAGYSLPLKDRTLWLFGDIFLLHPTDPKKPYVGEVSNSGLLVRKGSGAAPLRDYRYLTDPSTGLARPALPNAEGEGKEIRYWPYGGWHDSERNRAYLYYARVRFTGEGGPFGFVIEGQGLSRADTKDPERITFERLKDESGKTIWWENKKQPQFGSAVVANAPGNHLYIVGYREQEGKKIGLMARVLKGKIEDLSSYEYMAGTSPSPRWSSKIEEAADVEGLSDFPTELSVSYNPYLGGYLAVHSVDIQDRIRLSLADKPWGPYRQIGEIGAPHRAFEKAFCYAGKEHLELAEDKGRVIYVTYVDSQRYWLQLLKVTLDKE